MKRAIKFRAWDEAKLEMHSNFQFIKTGDEESDWIVFVSNRLDISGATWSESPHLSRQFKVMQFTGLLDKNGVEIYESDIIKVAPDARRAYDAAGSDGSGVLEHQLIQWATDRGGWMTTRYQHSTKPDSHFWLFIDGCEVVGNIYQSPELVKAAGK